MPTLVRLSDLSDVDNYTPPEGFAVLFISPDSNSNLVLKAKLSDGSMCVIGSGKQESEQSVVTDELLMLSGDATIADAVLELSEDAEVEGTVLVLNE